MRLALAAAAAAAAAASAAAAAAAKAPNIVVLFIDDFGWGDVGANTPQHPSETPNIDALANQGMRFTDFHAMPLCTPSRAQLLTGRLAPRHGVCSNFAQESLYGLNQSELTLAAFLHERGYATGMMGKHHLGHQPGYHPSYRGFDRVVTVPYSVDMGCVDNSSWFVPPTGANRPVAPNCLAPNQPGGQPVALPLYNATTNCSGTGDCDATIVAQPLDLSALSDTYNAEAARFIGDSAGSPFFLYFAFSHTHVPLMSASRWVNSSTARDVFHDVVREVDNSIGAVVAALKAAGVYDNTFIFATADNGPWQAKCGLAGSAGPYVGAYQQVLAPGSASLKDTPWEGGHRVFGVVAGPGVPHGSVSHALASTLDVWPTVAALVGAPLPGDRSYDGVDLAPVLFDGAPGVRDVLFIPDTSGATECHLTGARYRNYTVYWQTSGQSSCTRDFSPLPAVAHDPPLAFDLATDPGQKTPVPLPPDVLAAVTAARDAKMADVRATFRTTTDWAGGGRAAWPCCNRNEPDCGCRSVAGDARLN